MKKLILLLTMIIMMLCSTAYGEEVIKIAMDNEVKPAKDIGTGKGISFVLPELNDSDYYIYGIELAVFEKGETEKEYHIYTDDKGNETKKKYIQNPDSLNFNIDFGDVADYKNKAKYKIGYRYYVRNISDTSIILIAGNNVKDGWRLVGEEDGTVSTDAGFMFYKNENPEIAFESLTYKYHSIDGIKENSYGISELESNFLPSDAFENGIKVFYDADDFDSEDKLIISYELKNYFSDELICKGELPSNNIIKADVKCEIYKLKLKVTDNFGGKSETEWINIMVDTEKPYIYNSFYDGGYALRGSNLFSDFTIMDNQNEYMEDGKVYATVYNDGNYVGHYELENKNEGIYRLDKSSVADGKYTVELKMFDKAGNMAEDVFYQTLDNTKPSIEYITPEENPEATYYSKWMNESKKIIIDVSDNCSKIKKFKLTCNGSSEEVIEYDNPEESQRIVVNVTTSKTGKIRYIGNIYDDAKAIDKGNNTYDADSFGNNKLFVKYVWLDKTKPIITTNHEDDGWEEAPYTIEAMFEDYPSQNDVSDASGVKEKLYAITNNSELPTDWQFYEEEITINESGIYYIHFKCTDNAGNQQILTQKVRLNEKSVVGQISVTDDYKHTISYNSFNFYVVKNTAYNTKYSLQLTEKDINDKVKVDIDLVCQDDNENIKKLSVISTSNGKINRDVEFNLSYLTDNGKALSDGVYDLFVTTTEIKEDFEEVKTNKNIKVCEIVIKRNAPPTPIINVFGGKVSINYPEEYACESLNKYTIKEHYKKEYKTVRDNDVYSNSYKTYTGEFDVDNFVVTALYTDIAGNTSVATKRVYKNSSDDDEETGSIIIDGSIASIEESRAANVYYIGIRRDKDTGINTSVFDFMQ